MVLQSLVHPLRTLEQLNKQRESKLFTDVTILVSGEKFPAHKALLAAHSPVFKQVLEDTSLTQENAPNINLDGVESTYFSILLDFIYTSKLAIDLSNVDHVSATSAFLQVLSVVDLCTKFKEANLTNAPDVSTTTQSESVVDVEGTDESSSDQIEVEVTEEEFPSLHEETNSAATMLSTQGSAMEEKKSLGSKRGRKSVMRLACPVCKKEMIPSKLGPHIRSHTNEKTFSCNVCGNLFANIYNLKIHERKHTGEKPYKCTLCARAFADPSSLCKHKLWHAGIKKKKCPECGRMFSTLAQVTEHMRTHTKEKPFRCFECGKRYAYKCDLTRHSREHTGDMIGPCPYCGRLFNHRGNYLVHLRAHEKRKAEVRIGSETFLMSDNHDNAVTITSQEQDEAVVKVADLAGLMAQGHEIEVVISDGQLVVKQPVKEEPLLPNDVIGADVINVDADVINTDPTEGPLVIVDQIMEQTELS